MSGLALAFGFVGPSPSGQLYCSLISGVAKWFASRFAAATFFGSGCLITAKPSLNRKPLLSLILDMILTGNCLRTWVHAPMLKNATEVSPELMALMNSELLLMTRPI